jgi:DinB superfamily
MIRGDENTMKNDHDKALRQHLVELLNGGGAHAKFEDVIADFPSKFRGQKPRGMPHSPWMLLEHLRIAQKDILEFCRDPKYAAPKWPDDYWPKNVAPPSASAWAKSIADFHKDLKAVLTLVSNPKTDLFARIPWGDGQTILREALLVADHNAYHIAQLVDVRRMLGAWKG